jgi:hypothetical protein
MNKQMPFVSIAAVVGAILLVVGTVLHPMHEDPNVAAAAFREYAADSYWLNSHLLQLAGVALMIVVLVRLCRAMAGGPADGIASLCAHGAAAGLAVACTLQAVDGIALKTMVDAWAAAPLDQQASLFHATFAVRQIEVGLASMLSLLLGLVLCFFGIAQIMDGRFPRLLGYLLLVYGALSVVAGYIMASSGFSELAMMINMPASLLLLVWVLAIAYYCWRHPEVLESGLIKA